MGRYAIGNSNYSTGYKHLITDALETFCNEGPIEDWATMMIYTRVYGYASVYSLEPEPLSRLCIRVAYVNNMIIYHLHKNQVINWRKEGF